MATVKDEKIKLALNVLRRMPPHEIEEDLVRILCLTDPALEDKICQYVDLPLKVKTDPKSGKPFVICDYNRDGDSYRSPWSNSFFYFEDDDKGQEDDEELMTPSGPLRALEEDFNKIFNVYRHQYFESGVSSVYLWNLGSSNDLNHFAGAFLISKPITKLEISGLWSSIHVIEAKKNQRSDNYTYKLTSTVLINISRADNGTVGELNLSGSSSEVNEGEGIVNPKDVNQGHTSIIGPMIENAELNLRNDIEGQYFGKTNSVLCGMRTNDAKLRDVRNKMANIAKGMNK